jgi:hypothetical protein
MLRAKVMITNCFTKLTLKSKVVYEGDEWR